MRQQRDSTRPRRSLRADESGMTLVELIVYGAISVLVLGVMVGVVTAGFGSESSSRNRDVATGQSVVVNESLQSSLRNAVACTLDTSDDASTLTARVADGDSGWTYRAWTITAAGELRTADADSGAAAAAAAASGAVLATGVSAAGDTAFTFNENSGLVTYTLTITNGSVSLPVSGSAVAAAAGSGESCENN